MASSEVEYYKDLRVVITMNESTNKEDVCFTEDIDLPIDEFCIPGWIVKSDCLLHDLYFPVGFPLEDALRKQ